jgi:hypothetical protein
MRRIVCVLLLASSVPLMAGCVTVKPWERDLHAREDMQPNALDLAIDEHIYFSKEASSGGRGFGGGGCGCN